MPVPDLSPAEKPVWTRAEIAAAVLTVRFMVEVTDARRGRDLLDALIFSAIVHANLAQLRQDRDLADRYAGPDEVLPDELRRPISTNAIAQSLRLPFESVRRRTRSMVAEGRCVSGPEGLYVPAAYLHGEEQVQMQLRRVQQLLLLHAGLKAAGCLEGAAESLAGLTPENRMQGNRLLSGYVLRTADRLIELAGGFPAAVVFLGLLDLNLATWDVSSPASPPGPSAASVRQLAEHLRMPRETVRRRLVSLRASGRVRAWGTGFVCTIPANRRGQVQSLAMANLHELQALFSALSALRQRGDPN